MARNTANIEKRRYRILHRTPAAYTQPADAAAFTTFLGTFTELGYCKDKTINLTFEKGEEAELDDGTKKLTEYNGKLEFTLLQSEVADYTNYETIENVEQDLLVYDSITKIVIFLPNALLAFLENVSSGNIEEIPASCEKVVTSKSDFRKRFAEPTS